MMSRSGVIDYQRLEQIALNMRYVIFVFIANFIIMNMYRKSAAVDGGFSMWGVLLLILSIVFAVLTFKWSKALQHPVVVAAVFAILTFIPLVGLIVLLVLMVQSRKAFAPAGIKMGLLGADMSQFEQHRPSK